MFENPKTFFFHFIIMHNFVLAIIILVEYILPFCSERVKGHAVCVKNLLLITISSFCNFYEYYCNRIKQDKGSKNYLELLCVCYRTDPLSPTFSLFMSLKGV